MSRKRNNNIKNEARMERRKVRHWIMCVFLPHMYKQDFLINCLSSRSLFSCWEQPKFKLFFLLFSPILLQDLCLEIYVWRWGEQEANFFFLDTYWHSRWKTLIRRWSSQDFSLFSRGIKKITNQKCKLLPVSIRLHKMI